MPGRRVHTGAWIAARNTVRCSPSDQCGVARIPERSTDALARAFETRRSRSFGAFVTRRTFAGRARVEPAAHVGRQGDGSLGGVGARHRFLLVQEIVNMKNLGKALVLGVSLAGSALLVPVSASAAVDIDIGVAPPAPRVEVIP